MYNYYLIHKPYGMLPQFTDELKRPTLSSLYKFPKDVYPVGRLDMDSEGLLLLTNDKRLNNRLLNPKFGHEREYFVQVEGMPYDEKLEPLKQGVTIQGEKTKPADFRLLGLDIGIPPRVPPIRVRLNIPDYWISLTLTEGKNRQVRKMTAAVGYPTLRLIRVRIENLLIGKMQAGDVKELTGHELTTFLSRVGIDAK